MNGRLILNLVNAVLFAICFALAMASPSSVFFWLGFLWAAASIAYAVRACRQIGRALADTREAGSK